MSWSVVEYVEALRGMGTRCTGTQDHIENPLRERFPPAVPQHIVGPCVMVDSEGIILLWFLPGLMSLKRQVGRILKDCVPTDSREEDHMEFTTNYCDQIDPQTA